MNHNFNDTDQGQNPDSSSQNNYKNVVLPWIITIIISAWMIAMGILGAGYLISKEIAKTGQGGGNNEVPVNDPVDISVTEDMMVQGNEDARVTLIVFADFQCPFCAMFHNESYYQLKSEYIDTGKLRLAFADFAFLGEESYKAAEAARCAADQNRFWEYHDKLYESQSGENEGTFADANLKNYATDINLDESEFNNCFDARIHKPIVESMTNFGSSYGVNSTPTLFINGMKFEGALPYENLKLIIDTQLADEE